MNNSLSPNQILYRIKGGNVVEEVVDRVSSKWFYLKDSYKNDRKVRIETMWHDDKQYEFNRYQLFITNEEALVELERMQLIARISFNVIRSLTLEQLRDVVRIVECNK